MRSIVLLSALMGLTACNVDNDTANEKVTVKYDRERIQKAGRAAESVATGVANVAKTTGKAVKREVGDIDVKVTRTRNEEKPAQ